MQARHYSPLVGRFLQPDPTAQEANLYAYAANSPITKFDPAGNWAISIRVAIELIKIFGTRFIAAISSRVLLWIGPFALNGERLGHII
jgi:hypothetical protein